MENQINSSPEDYQIFELWAKYKHFWPWVLFSVAVFLAMAFVYVNITPPKYQRVAQVMIRGDNEMFGKSSIYGEIVVGKISSAKNEVEAFKSINLIQDVVREMNTAISYSQKKGLGKIMLYESPVEADFPDSSEDDSFIFQVEFGPDNSVILSKFEYKKNKYNQKIVGKLVDIIKTPIGDVKISPTNYYSDYDKSYPLLVFKNSIKNETRSFAGRLKVSHATKEISIIKLEITDTNIPRAEKSLNTLIDKYNKNWLAEKELLIKNSLLYLEDRLPIVEQELRTIEDELYRYKYHNLLTEVQSNALIASYQSNNFAKIIVDLNVQLSINESIKDFLDRNDNISSMMPFNFGLIDYAIESQMLEHNNLLRVRDQMLANSSEENPRVNAMNDRLQSMRQSIVFAVNTQIESLSMRLFSLKAQETQMMRQIASNQELAMQLITLERERKTKENIYQLLLQKKEEIDKTLTMNTSNVRIISPPSGSNVPVYPKKMVILLIAFILGIAIPGCVIWAKENFNTAIRGKTDLEGLSVPFLGMIALAENEYRKNDEYLRVSETGRDLINETFRMVRTSLDATCGKDKKVVMFTSFEPGCGKTFVALNLAMSFVLAGKKIALVDVDMRTAKLSKVSELSDHDSDIGYCSFLNKNRTYSQLIQYDIRKNRYWKGLDIFPVGSIPLNPAELLMGDQFSLMLEKLKTRYDYVFLDCTPLDIVTDSRIVSKLADLSVFIVREDYTDRRILQRLETLFRRGQYSKKELSDKQKEIEKKIRKEEQEIDRKEIKLIEKYEFELRRIELDKKLLNNSKEKHEDKLNDLYKKKIHEEQSLKEEREKLEADNKLRLNNERKPFEEIALILNGVKMGISYNKHHTRYQKKVESVAKQIRRSDKMKELPIGPSKCPDTEKDKLLSGDGTDENLKLLD